MSRIAWKKGTTMPEQPEATCEWKPDREEEDYAVGCGGRTWFCVAAYRFCPFCGKKLVIVR
jgi:hypothetical protein